MTDMEADIRDIKQQVMEISKKVDELLYEKEISSLMKLSDKSLSEFFENEPDIYRLKDLKVRYK
ncbi:MAG: hypothetical protein PQ975_00595 [Methanobacterium sp.]